jgi:hypothetical protein
LLAYLLSTPVELVPNEKVHLPGPLERL